MSKKSYTEQEITEIENKAEKTGWNQALMSVENHYKSMIGRGVLNISPFVMIDTINNMKKR